MATTTVDRGVHDERDEAAALEAGGDASPQGDDTDVHLVGLHLDPFDVEALGLRVRSDGVDLNLDAVPDDGRMLGEWLAKASQLLATLRRRVKAAAARVVDAVRQQLERLGRWILEKLQRLVRHAAGKLLKLAALKLTQRVKQKATGGASGSRDRAKQRSSGQRGQQGERSQKRRGRPDPNRSNERGGRTSQQAPESPRRGSGGPDVLSPDQVKQVLTNMPSRKVKKMAKGLSDEQAEEVASLLPDEQSGKAVPAVRQLEQTAQEMVKGG